MLDQQATQPAHVLAARAAGLSPYMLGSLDAAARRPCNPDDFVWPGDAEAYSEGYRDEARAMLQEAAIRLGNMVVAMVGGPELERLLDTRDYAEDILDREFIRMGGA